MNAAHGQSQYQVRFDWGVEGALTIGENADVIVVVDVLSFGTTVGLAVEQGLEVLLASPEGAADVAALHRATVAGVRGSAGPSLSPASMTSGNLSGIERLVLPSPSGSRVSAALAEHPATVVAGSLRNRTAIAKWALEKQGDKGDRFTVAVIASGEQRDDGSTRFAIEDLLGAGAVIDALADVGIDYCSPEAAAASAAFTGLRNATGHLIGASASGRELTEQGYRADVDLAIALDASTTVPVLGADGYRG